VTQLERVRAALRQHPGRGICAVDFLRYPTIDGGPPITRLAARIGELVEAGVSIENAGTREKCKVYRLAGGLVEAASGPVPGRERVVEPVPPPAAPEGQLFDLKPRSTIYDTEDAA